MPILPAGAGGHISGHRVLNGLFERALEECVNFVDRHAHGGASFSGSAPGTSHPHAKPRCGRVPRLAPGPMIDYAARAITFPAARSISIRRS